MDSQTTRPSLLSRVGNPADQAAWQEFEARYRELILRYARVRGLQYSDAEDVRQLVMLGLSKSLRNFEYSPERGRFRDYVGRIVRNAVSRFMSRPKTDGVPLDSVVLAVTPAEEDADDGAVWEREWVDHHYRLAMETVRTTFEPKSVGVFERLLMGDNVDTVAGAFDLSTQAVHKIKQRIRDRMQELIAEQIREEEQPLG